MDNSSDLGKVVYLLSKKTLGQSEKLISYFGRDVNTVEAMLPLTKLQSDIFTDILLNPGTTSYNIAAYILYDGPFDVSIWTEALNEYVRRSPLLRCDLTTKNELTYLCVRKPTYITPDVFDFSEQQLSTEQIKDWVRSYTDKPYQLDTALSRHLVIRLNNDSHLICIATHQMTVDGVAGRLYFENIGRIYQSLTDQKELPEDGSIKPFHEYIFSVNENFNNEETEAFWQTELSGLTFPPKNSFSHEKGSRHQQLNVPLEDVKKIKAFSKQKGVTPSFLLKTLFAFVIKDLSGTENGFLLFENRHGREKEYLKTMGAFLYSSPIPVPSELSTKAGSIEDWLGHFLEHRNKSKNFQNISFGKVLELIKRPGGIRVFYNYVQLANLDFIGSKCDMELFESFASNEVHFFIEERPEQLIFNLFFDEEYFDAYRFLERFLYVTRQLINKDTSLAKVNWILPDEELLLLHSFQSRIPLTPGDTFVSLFNSQVNESSYSIAAAYEDSEITYKALDQRSNIIAAFLKNKKITKGSIVAVHCKRSIELLAMIVATLKIGAVYLPIDPAISTQRKEYILFDAQPDILVLDESDFDPREKPAKTQMVLINSISDDTTAQPPLDTPGSHDIAYIIYTSGSTGKPKGCVINHAGMLNHLLAKVETFNVTCKSRILQNAPQGFDISVWQFLTSLVKGGTVVIYPNNYVQDIDLFIERVEMDRLTIIEMVPSYLRLFLEYVNSHQVKFDALEYLIATGEELNSHLARRCTELLPGIKLVNAYGPTEASDDITHYQVADPALNTSVPIGSPIRNMSIYILNEGGKLCYIGQPGEICVAGVGVGPGYLNLPELTIKSFIPNSIQPKDGDTIYCTGDIGLWQKDGVIRYAGRNDNQWKIGGHRIELGEIESIALESGLTRECSAVGYKNGNENFIVLYLAGTRDVIPYLKNFMRKFLNEILIPKRFVTMDSLPLTPNGKVDINALRSLPAEPEYHTDESLPLLQEEEELKSIWQMVLKIDNIHPDQNFFDLGGHSLTAMHVIQQVQDQLGVKIPLKILFEYPSVRSMASEIRSIKKITFGFVGTEIENRDQFII